MAASTSRINIEFLSKGDSEVNKAFKRLGAETRRLNRDFVSLSDKAIRRVKREFVSLGSGSRTSLNAMQAQRNALNGLRNMADVTSLEFKQLTADIARLDAQMRKASMGATGLKGKLGTMAKGFGAVASAGIFGGVEGALGSAIGFAVGGVPGAIIGGTAGSFVGQLREGAGEIASFSANLELQRKALKLVIGDTQKYAKAQQFLATTSTKLAIPQSVITRQFTSLTASVTGAGMSVDDAEKAFLAIASGIRGTGGSLEDMKSAMRAVSQVFSKGKVSAEELRQQLGERLPGAFTLFADSMNLTPELLDKALEQGKVTLEDFMGFAELLLEKYGDNAELLASAPEAAGDRLRTAMEELGDDLGAILRPIGAAFQELSEDIVRDLADIVKHFRKMVDGIAKERKLIEVLSLTKNERQKINTEAKDKAVEAIENTILTKEDADKIAEHFRKNNINTFGMLDRKIKELYESVGKTYGEMNSFSNDIFYRYYIATGKNLSDLTTEFRREEFQRLFDLANNDIFDFQNYRAKIRQEEESDTGDGDGTNDLSKFNDIQKGAKAYFDTIKEFGKQTQDAVANAFKGMEDALVNFVMTGKLNFKDLARSIIADLARITVRAALLNFLSPFPFFDKVTGSAKGNVFAKNKIVPYAKGGIVTKPTVFPMADGLGLMGEKGAEAVLPLKRGSNGKLGVIAQGGGVGNIVVNVDASGSAVEANEAQSAELGKMLGSVIQAELIKQQRPGGLLS